MCLWSAGGSTGGNDPRMSLPALSTLAVVGQGDIGPLCLSPCSRPPEALSHGGSGRGSKSSQMEQNMSIFEVFAGSMLANIPLEEASHMAKFKAHRHSKGMVRVWIQGWEETVAPLYNSP